VIHPTRFHVITIIAIRLNNRFATAGKLGHEEDEGMDWMIRRWGDPREGRGGEGRERWAPRMGNDGNLQSIGGTVIVARACHWHRRIFSTRAADDDQGGPVVDDGGLQLRSVTV